VGFKLFKQSFANQPDEYLMRLICDVGDRKAFELLYDRYSRKLLSFSTRIVSNREQAEDIVQEVFIRIIEKPGAFDQAKKFSTWIFTIANNLCLNSIRNETNREKLINEHYEQSEIVIQHPSIDEKLVKQKINAIYKELNEKEKTVFVLRFEHELSIKEIAEIASMPEGSVKSCLFYLLKKIDVQLQPYKTT
jgi:RNA polymerase sigma-70 factor (ECF subfamily)